ncbi:MAG: sigma-54-dependent Fis family transcriptional regulator, partial [Desulfobacterales bacterium]|nr:sigma-54-dependent Fis family transcriptional regulator [Desulfobacterales bacterium]
HFLVRAARQLKKKKPTVPKELFALMKTYTYPGNIRELQSMIFDAISQHKTGVLSLEVFKTHLGRNKSAATVTSAESAPAGPTVTFTEQLPTIKEATRLLVEEALKRSGGNQSIAAGMLGISQQALSKRLKKIQK